ncbi:RNA/RNP complex-1-interacting phosphatase [Anas platyrhynchos]|uniref:RNA/RNP complex-1-interacting phosphatase n=1 Tax=Anas platyrhynchos TaxID=8839 RepID=R0LNS6_ANAPL|nr:RNA/RNP complex-1-interacting phosphatase [Anas platyrhynchos]
MTLKSTWHSHPLEKELPATLCYSKIWTMGHEIPNNQTIFQFKSVVKNFLRDNKDNVFNRARGHPIERMNYIEDLQKRSRKKNSGSTKKNRKQGHKAPTQHQELVHKHRVPEQRWPCSLGPRNCPVSLPHNRQHNRLCFPALSSQHQPQEMHTARKRRRWRRKPVTV